MKHQKEKSIRPINSPRKTGWNLADFVRQVQTEAIRKVAWPQKQEVLVSAIMVLVLSVIAALFFLVVDQVFSLGLKTLLSF